MPIFLSRLREQLGYALGLKLTSSTHERSSPCYQITLSSVQPLS